MVEFDDNIKQNDPNSDDEFFFRLLGDYLKYIRTNAGFPTPEAFANVAGISRSQYSAYEAGKNLNLLTFRNVLLKLNIKVEDWLNPNVFHSPKDKSVLIAKMRQTRIDHVISQVKKKDTLQVANKLTPKIVQRYIDILIHCHTSKNRSYILVELIGLDDSYNTFKRVAGKLIEYGWLDYTDKTSKRSPGQGYVTTEAGKNILRPGKE